MMKRFVIFICTLMALANTALAKDTSQTGGMTDYDADVLPISVFRKLTVSGGQCFAKTFISHDLSKETEIWKQVVCENNITPSFLKWVQERLAASGQFLEVPHKRGDEAELDDAMYAAIETFQIDKNIARGGLTFETINALNEVKLK